MKKILLAALLFSALPVVAQAAGESTISGGYAQSHAKQDTAGLDEKPKGFNLKYRYEMNDNIGVIGSFTYTNQDYDFYNGNSKVGSGKFDYYSLAGGPSFRFNEYMSAYALIGASHGKAEVSATSQSESESKTTMMYGLGLQFNPFANVAIDASYEYSKLEKVKVDTFIIGVGYRF